MIHCVGDSHVNIFTGTSRIPGLFCGNHNEDKNEKVFTYNIGPKCAHNIVFKYERFLKSVESIKKNETIILSFGEVDCRIHFYKISNQQYKDIEDCIDETIDRYFSFVKDVKEKVTSDLIVYGPPPSKSNEALVNYENFFSGTQKDRNEICRKFNNRLKEECGKNGYQFLSLFEHVINEDFSVNDCYYRDYIHLNEKCFPYLKQELLNIKREDIIKCLKF